MFSSCLIHFDCKEKCIQCRGAFASNTLAMCRALTSGGRRKLGNRMPLETPMASSHSPRKWTSSAGMVSTFKEHLKLQDLQDLYNFTAHAKRKAMLKAMLKAITQSLCKSRIRHDRITAINL